MFETPEPAKRNKDHACGSYVDGLVMTEVTSSLIAHYLIRLLSNEDYVGNANTKLSNY